MKGTRLDARLLVLMKFVALGRNYTNFIVIIVPPRQSSSSAHRVQFQPVQTLQHPILVQHQSHPRLLSRSQGVLHRVGGGGPSLPLPTTVPEMNGRHWVKLCNAWRVQADSRPIREGISVNRK